MVDQSLILTVTMFTLVLIIVNGYSGGYSTSESILTFFLMPRRLIVYTILLAAPAFFFKWLPGSVLMFIIGTIFLLSSAGGF